jgi:hypothetical protein
VSYCHTFSSRWLLLVLFFLSRLCCCGLVVVIAVALVGLTAVFNICNCSCSSWCFIMVQFQKFWSCYFRSCSQAECPFSCGRTLWLAHVSPCIRSPRTAAPTKRPAAASTAPLIRAQRARPASCHPMGDQRSWHLRGCRAVCVYFSARPLDDGCWSHLLEDSILRYVSQLRNVSQLPVFDQTYISFAGKISMLVEFMSQVIRPGNRNSPQMSFQFNLISRNGECQLPRLFTGWYQLVPTLLWNVIFSNCIVCEIWIKMDTLW